MSPATGVRSASQGALEGSVIKPPGALVISLDFELHWGVRDIHDGSSAYMANVRGARDAVPGMLDLFLQYGVAATWATVGFLMAESREELEACHPVVRPGYRDRRLDPYLERVGRDEGDDPLHFAGSLVRRIASTPGQEIATHTYSHFYCLEEGATAESFSADLESARAIARARGVEVRSIVLPRNQWNAALAPVLLEHGIECFRGTQPGWMYTAAREEDQTRAMRVARLADSHLPVTSWSGTNWTEIARGDGLTDVRASCFLRPLSGSHPINELRFRRIARGLTTAARHGRVFHLWWHPHNFGARIEDHLAFLGRILDHYQVLSEEWGMRSMSMIEASRRATRSSGAERGTGYV
jgi:peptidoglycan/xylan/chitin deacetylase (PgdA/CDA1 family)